MLEANEIFYLIIGAFLGYLIPKIDKIPKYLNGVKRRRKGDYNIGELYRLSKKPLNKLTKKEREVLINFKKEAADLQSKHSDLLLQKR